RGRYTKESMAHPGKMLPSIARYLIATYTQPGEPVCDPMAGIGTTVVEAMHLGRHGFGVEYEPRWARLAADNIALAQSQGATGPAASSRSPPAPTAATANWSTSPAWSSPPALPPDCDCTRNAPR